MQFLAGLTLEPAPRTVLGVSASATAEEIKAAYKKRALETHPDKGGDADTFRKVKSAYEALKTASGTVRLTRPGVPNNFGAQAKVPKRKAPGTPWPSSPGGSASPLTPTPRSSRKVFYGDDVAAVPQKRNKTMEQEIDSAFSDLPKRPPATAASRERAERVSMQKATIDKIRATPIHEVWEQLTKVSPDLREQAINSFPQDVRGKLRDYLLQKKRSEAPAHATAASDVGGAAAGNAEAAEDSSNDSSSSDSSGSSSSSSSTSEDEELGQDEGLGPPGNKAPMSLKMKEWARQKAASNGTTGGLSQPAAPLQQAAAASVGRAQQGAPPGPARLSAVRRWPKGTLKPAEATAQVSAQAPVLSPLSALLLRHASVQ